MARGLAAVRRHRGRRDNHYLPYLLLPQHLSTLLPPAFLRFETAVADAGVRCAICCMPLYARVRLPSVAGRRKIVRAAAAGA